MTAYREIGHAAAQRAQRQQAGRIGPLQVIDADHQRPGQREFLRQVSERIDRPGTAAPGRWSP